MVVLTALSIII